MSKKRADATHNREQLLHAAEELIAQHGPGISFNLIAEKAGVGRATMFRHFSDKNALMAALCAGIVKRYLEQSDQITKTENALELLAEIIFGFPYLVSGAEGFYFTDPECDTLMAQLHAPFKRIAQPAQISQSDLTAFVTMLCAYAARVGDADLRKRARDLLVNGLTIGG